MLAMEELELLTLEDVARILTISEESVRIKLRNGEIKGFKLGRGSKAHWKVRRRELERYIEKMESQDR